MPSGKKRKGHKMATHKRKKRLRKNRHKNAPALRNEHEEQTNSRARSQVRYPCLGLFFALLHTYVNRSLAEP